MSQKISEMTPAAALTGAELLAGVQSNGNVKVTAQQIANLVVPPPALGGYDPWVSTTVYSIGSRVTYSDKLWRSKVDNNVGNSPVEGANWTEVSKGATVEYVDLQNNRHKWKHPAHAATTGNIVLSGAQTVDGVALAAENICLVKNQTVQSENGLWTVKTGAWVRCSFASEGVSLEGAVTLVLSGTTNAGKAYKQTTYPVTLGTSAIVFAEFGGGSSITPATQGEAETAGDATLANRNNVAALTARSFRWAWDYMLTVSAAMVSFLSALGIFDSRTTVSVVTGVLTLDMASKRFGRFVMDVASSADFTIALANITNMIDLEVMLILTGTRIITLPTGTQMMLSEKDAGRWNEATRQLTLQAATGSYYKLVFSKSGSVYLCDASTRYL